MFDWITEIINKSGYVGIALLMFLENVFPPIPSELIMPMAGFLASQGEFTYWGVAVVGTIGSLLGQVLLYMLGRKLGKERVENWVEKHGYWAAVTPEELEKAEDWFERHKGSAVFFCRLIPGLRSLISIPAGLINMKLPSFVAYTLAGTAIWTTALVSLGKVLGDNYDKVEQYLNPVSYVIVAWIVGSYFWKVFKGYRRQMSHA